MHKTSTYCVLTWLRFSRSLRMWRICRGVNFGLAVSYIWRQCGMKTFTKYISRWRKWGFLFKTDIYNTKHEDDARQLLLQGKDIFTFQTKCQIYADPWHVIPKTMRHLKQNKYLLPLYVFVVIKFSSISRSSSSSSNSSSTSSNSTSSSSSRSSSSLRTALFWKAITTTHYIKTQKSAVLGYFTAEAWNNTQ